MESQFEIIGYFEEIWDATTRRILGTRRCAEQPERKICLHGQIDFTITEPLEIMRGHKTVRIFASKLQPVALFSRLYPLCGKLKSEESLDLSDKNLSIASTRAIISHDTRPHKNQQKTGIHMKVTHPAIVAMFVALGFDAAKNWDAPRCNTKLQKLLEVINDPEEVNADMIDNADSKQLFKEIKAAHKAGKAITVEQPAEEEAPKKKVAALADDEDEKPAKSAKAKPAADEEEPAAKPAKKKPAADEDEKPAAKAKAAKSDKAPRETVGSKLEGALTGKFRTHAELIAAAGLDKGKTYYDALKALVKAKKAERGENKEGATGWKAV